MTEDAMTDPRDRLELASESAGEEPPLILPGHALYEPVVAALKSVFDPEIPVDIYELGLIYEVRATPANDLVVKMTLTAPGCPVAGEMPIMVENAVASVEGVAAVTVNLVWDPPWDMSLMSDEARLELGMM